MMRVPVLFSKKYSADTINYVIDSFNYILKHRKFSYDSLERLYDKTMIFRIREVDTTENVELDSLYFDDDFDYNFDDTTFFYDE